MDSGVHVWSTPLGYCDDTEGRIKDEEEVSEELQDGGFPEAGDPTADPLNLTADPLSISTADDPPAYGDPLAVFGLAADTGSAEEEEKEAERADSRGCLPAAGPSSVITVPDEFSAESADGQDPETAMWFKAEPEDASALTSDPITDDPPVVDEVEDYPPSPDPALPVNLIDPESGRELFTCRICRISYKMKMLLQGHYNNVHPGYKPYKCDICGNRFRKENFVRIHRKLHTGEKDFTCDACGKGFVSRARLTVHRKTARFCPASKSFDEEALRRRDNGEPAVWKPRWSRPLPVVNKVAPDGALHFLIEMPDS